MINAKALLQKIESGDVSYEDKLLALGQVETALKEMRDRKEAVLNDRVGMIVDALKTMQAKVAAQLEEAKAIVPEVGPAGPKGEPGERGLDGASGRDGRDGVDGRNGEDGQDGVSVTDARIDFDGSLIITLSTGREMNVGEVVAPDLAEKIKVITNGGGTSQGVLDAIAALQTQINNLIPSQTGNAGKFLTTNGTSTSWASIVGGLTYQGTWNASTNTPALASGVGVNGYYYIVATAGSTNLDGITDWQIGDWLMFNGTVWQKIDQSNLVTSVNGQTGAVSIAYADLAGAIPTWNQNTTGTASNVTGTVAFANGGTGETTRQNAMDALAGAVTSGQYLRGNGTDVVMSAIQAADVPTLNQNTTGTAANVTGIVAVANGGSGTATPSLVAGTNVTITGSWPNQTIAASGGGGGGSSAGSDIFLANNFGGF